jgi:hypothetical protein
MPATPTLSLDPPQMMYAGTNSFQLTGRAIITNEDYSNQGQFSYTSSSITVSGSGLITNISAPGTFSITVTWTSSNPGIFNSTSANVNFTIVQAQQSITFQDIDPSQKKVGTTVTLQASALGNAFISYSSLDTSIVQINGSSATFLSAGTCTITASSSGGLYSPSTADQSVTVTDDGAPCFTAGTMIRVPSGEVAVETLRRGDLVVTASGLVVPIKAALLTRIAKTTAATAPYRIPAGTYGSTQPRDLVLSPTHAIQIRKGVWMPPFFAAKSNTAIKQIGLGESIEYYHLECPVYLRDNLIANGCVVESFGVFQSKTCPYTWSARLGGFTRSSSVTRVTRA